MDLRSPVTNQHPEVEWATLMSRVVGIGCWLVGLAIFLAACVLREPWLFVAFGAWYLSLAVIVTAVAAVPRKRQRMLDHEWGRLVQELAIRDELTGLHNRRYFNTELEAQFAACREQAKPLTLAIVDLNDFKSINDTFGHAAGDVALRMAGQAILDASPSNATVARTGGDEFAIIMPDKARSEGEAVAQRIRDALEAANFVVKGRIGVRGRIRATVGVATLDRGHDPSTLLHEADASLYERKRAQRAA